MPVRNPDRAPNPQDIDIFLSYSHSADKALAPALQRGLSHLAKRWYEPRALRVFRDGTDLSVAHDLTAEIEDALRRSRFFVLLASPEAAASRWVAQEIAYWQRYREPETFLIALTGGTVAWGRGDFDWRATTALPRSLSGYFAREPLWADLSFAHTRKQQSLRNREFRSQVASLAAPARGKSKERLDSEDTRRQRRFRQASGVAVTALILLVVAVLVLNQVAGARKVRADKETRTSAARLMASTAGKIQSTDVRSALLLAVAAYRTDPTRENLAALLRANLTSPSLVRYLTTDSPVTALEGSADGQSIVAGLADGRVVRWVLGHPTAEEQLMTLPSAVSMLSVSADGKTVAASDGSRVMLWRNGSPEDTLSVPAGQRIDIVAVSPSGNTAIVHGRLAVTACTESTSCLASSEIYAASSREPLATHDDSWDEGGLVSTSNIVITSDDEVLLFARGDWSRLEIHQWKTEDGRTGNLFSGALQSAGDPAGDGGSFGANSFGVTGKGGPLPVWRIGGPQNGDAPEGVADIPQPDSASAPVLNMTGTTAAGLYRSGGIYVVPVAPRGTHPAAVELGGAAVESTKLLRFLGASGRRLISAAGNQITLWDLDQVDRLATVVPLSMTRPCRACPPPSIALSPDGGTALISGELTGSDNRDAMVVQPLHTPDEKPQVLADLSGIPLWRADGRAIIMTSSGTVSRSPLPSNLTAIAAPSNRAIEDARIGADPAVLTVVDAKGSIYLQDANSGKITEKIPGPPDLAPGDQTLQGAAIDSTGHLVATVYNKTVRVFDITTRQEVGQPISADEVTNLMYAGPHLVVRRKTDLEVWKPDGSAEEQTIGSDEPYAPNWAVSLATDSSGATLAHVDSRGAVIIVDRADALTLATIPSADTNTDIETGVAISADGRHLITASDGGAFGTNGKIVERALSPDALIKTACALAGHDLTAAEWQQLLNTSRPPEATCP